MKSIFERIAIVGLLTAVVAGASLLGYEYWQERERESEREK